ncbi:hypothetical protein A3Q56_03309 [Intoshia linei]|uniref:Uncharacterized protein n=1 Tax=Intoshia linei TaxID=1819745 RepID=A0A177B5T7_9BILA|nr:hypothetical protein A3Q56_03309 [Intoshia linei]
MRKTCKLGLIIFSILFLYKIFNFHNKKETKTTDKPYIPIRYIKHQFKNYENFNLKDYIEVNFTKSKLILTCTGENIKTMLKKLNLKFIKLQDLKKSEIKKFGKDYKIIKHVKLHYLKSIVIIDENNCIYVNALSAILQSYRYFCELFKVCDLKSPKFYIIVIKKKSNFKFNYKSRLFYKNKKFQGKIINGSQLDENCLNCFIKKSPNVDQIANVKLKYMNESIIKYILVKSKIFKHNSSFFLPIYENISVYSLCASPKCWKIRFLIVQIIQRLQFLPLQYFKQNYLMVDVDDVFSNDVKSRFAGKNVKFSFTKFFIVNSIIHTLFILFNFSNFLYEKSKYIKPFRHNPILPLF